MQRPTIRIAFATLAVTLASSISPAQDKPDPQQAEFTAQLEKFQKALEPGPVTGKLGSVAQIEVPKGLSFTGKRETATFLELLHNIPSGDELGMVAPDDLSWFVTFDYSATGHVKDDDKADLDADKLLDQIKEGNESVQEERKQRGWPEMHVVGWHKPPFYDPVTHNLTWGILVRGQHGESINWSTRFLGRQGIVKVDLVADPSNIDATLPVFNELMKGFSYVQGQTYGEFKAGDKIAEYGLAALVAGGAGALAVKTGLFAKFWKLIVLAVGAIGAFFKKLFGSGKKTDANESAS